MSKSSRMGKAQLNAAAVLLALSAVAAAPSVRAAEPAADTTKAENPCGGSRRARSGNPCGAANPCGGARRQRRQAD